MVYCNCDDPTESNFFRFFSLKFDDYGLKQLIATCYKSKNRDLFSRHDSEKAIKLVYNGFRDGDTAPRIEDTSVRRLSGDGDFRSQECADILKDVDIVVTNPPFSLFREYVSHLIKNRKKFIILGNKNAVTYSEIYPLIQKNKLWIGYTPMGREMLFNVTDEYADYLVRDQRQKEGSSYRVVDDVVMARSSSTWFTNLTHNRRRLFLDVDDDYNPELYPKYENYNGIDVGKVTSIPGNYSGDMGVPITFLDKYNPRQFEIVGFRKGDDGKDLLVNGRHPYFRILVRNKKPRR